jgi:ribosomal-protein-alanine N-acetyltransferase
MKEYFLTSERVGFRHWKPEDLPLALQLWGDIEVTQLIGGPFTESQIRERLTKEIATQTEHGLQYWPIFDRASSDNIGCCGLRPYLKRPKTIELGFHLRPVYWGKGFAKEAASAAIRYAFDELGTEALFAGHNPKNELSRHLLGRLGFEFTHEELYLPTGLQHPSYLLTRAKLTQVAHNKS